MYKRAYFFSSNAPVTDDVTEDNEQESDVYKSKDEHLESNVKNDDGISEDNSIKAHPGNKATYCVHCKGKVFLNKESEEKHIKSKNHMKNVKKKDKHEDKTNKIKKEFFKRMNEVDMKGYNSTL